MIIINQNTKSTDSFGLALAITILLFGLVLFLGNRIFGTTPLVFEILGIVLLIIGLAGLGIETNKSDNDFSIKLSVGVAMGIASAYIISYNFPFSFLLYLPLAFVGTIMVIESFIGTMNRGTKNNSNKKFDVFKGALEILGLLPPIYTLIEFITRIAGN